MRSATLVPLLLLSGCGLADACENNTIREVSSAAGRAILFHRECGATTGFSTQVSFLKSGETNTDGGNIFVADGGSRLGAWGGPWADVAWSPAGQLIISYDASARIFTQARTKSGIDVIYRPIR